MTLGDRCIEFDDRDWYEFLETGRIPGEKQAALDQVDITQEDVAEALADWDRKAPEGWRRLLWTE